MDNNTLAAFDESAKKAQVIQMHGHEQPPVDKDYLNSLLLPKIDFEAYMRANEADKANVKQASDYTAKLIDFFHGDNQQHGKTLPWDKTHENFRFRLGEVTLWPGINGHGKSQVLGQVVNSLLSQNEKVCIASFEMHPYRTLARMTRQAIGTNSPSEQFIRDYTGWLVNKLWLYEQQGTVRGDRVLAVIYYGAKELGINHFVIDSLMKCGVRSDDFNAQKEFIDKLCAAARDLNIHIHLIAHSRKGDDEYSPPNKMDVAGTADITNQVDNVMTVWRNKLKEKLIRNKKASQEDTHKPDCMIICDKQRNGEWEGEIALWFNPASMRYLSTEFEKIWPMKITNQ
jgi:twinkle protein